MKVQRIESRNYTVVSSLTLINPRIDDARRIFRSILRAETSRVWMIRIVGLFDCSYRDLALRFAPSPRQMPANSQRFTERVRDHSPRP